MNITAAMSLVPEKVQAEKPEEVAALDLLALVASIAPISPPSSIAEAIERRKEYQELEDRKAQAQPMAEKILKAMDVRVKAKRALEEAKEEEESEIMDLIASTCRRELLAGVRTIGAAISRVGLRILVWAASATVSAVGGVISFLMANPLVAIGIGLVAIGYAGYKYYLRRKEVEGTVNTDSASTYSISSSEVKAATGAVPAKEIPETAKAPEAPVAKAKEVVATPPKVEPPKPTTTAGAARTTSPAASTKPEATTPTPSSDKPSASAAQVGKGKKQKKAVEISDEVKDAIANASKVVGVPVSLLTALAGIESSFGTNVTAGTSSAKGLFQFVKDTWADMIRKYGKQYGVPQDADPYDNKWSAIMAAAMIKHEGWPAVAKIVPNPSITDIYLTHFLGSSGGARFLRGYMANPNVDATTLVTAKQVAANEAIFIVGERNRTAKEVYDLFAGRLGKQLQKGESVIAHAESKDKEGAVVAKAPDAAAPAEPTKVAEAQPPVGAPEASLGSHEYVKTGSHYTKVRTA